MSELTQTSTTPETIRDALRQVVDPELFLSIVDMGLIYHIEVDEARKAIITMTLTTPHCPAGEEILANVNHITRSFPDLSDVQVDVVWQPPWSPEMMTPELKRSLGIETAPAAETVVEEEPPPPPPSRQPKKKGFLQRLFGG